jgi:hypothetical protein
VGINANNFEAAFRKVYIWARSLNVRPRAAPSISAGAGAPTDADADGSIHLRTDGTAGTSLYAMVSSAWIAMAPASFVATQLTTVALTPAIEAADTIAITFKVTDLAGGNVLRAQRLIVTAYEATMVEGLVTAVRMDETGAGSVISTADQARIIITTDANGDAIVTVRDVAGASSKVFHIVVQPISDTGVYLFGAASMATITFD